MDSGIPDFLLGRLSDEERAAAWERDRDELLAVAAEHARNMGPWPAAAAPKAVDPGTAALIAEVEASKKAKTRARLTGAGFVKEPPTEW